MTDLLHIEWARKRMMDALHSLDNDRTDGALLEAVFSRAWEYEAALGAPARTKELIRCARISKARRDARLKLDLAGRTRKEDIPVAIPSTPLSMRGALKRLTDEGFKFGNAHGERNIPIARFAETMSNAEAGQTVSVSVINDNVVSLRRVGGQDEVCLLTKKELVL